MREEKICLIMDAYEQNIIIKALNEMRNSLKSEQRATDAVDELLLKTAEAKPRQMCVKEERCYEAR